MRKERSLEMKLIRLIRKHERRRLTEQKALGGTNQK
jgi:hypothetical protein